MDINFITRAEYVAGMEELRDTMRDGFGGLNARLDKIDNKTEIHTVDIAEIKARALKIADEGRRKVLTVWDFILVSTTAAMTFELLTTVLGYHR